MKAQWLSILMFCFLFLSFVFIFHFLLRFLLLLLCASFCWQVNSAAQLLLLLNRSLVPNAWLQYTVLSSQWKHSWGTALLCCCLSVPLVVVVLVVAVAPFLCHHQEASFSLFPCLKSIHNMIFAVHCWQLSFRRSWITLDPSAAAAAAETVIAPFISPIAKFSSAVTQII